MIDVAEFNRLTDELKKKKNYKKDELASVHSVFMGLRLDETTAKETCPGLSRLQWQDAVSLLASKWPDVPEGSRYVFLQWRWDGKEKEAVIPACLAMAAAIYATDPASGASFLGGGITSAKFPATGRPHLLKGLRKSWMEARDGASRPALEQLAWGTMEPAWRWELVEAIADAAILAPPDGKNRAQKVDHRRIVLDWHATLSRSHTADSYEAKRLAAITERLSRPTAPPTVAPAVPDRNAESAPQPNSAPQPAAAASPDRHATTAARDVMGTEQSSRDNRAAPADDATAHYDRVVAAGDRAYRALDSLSEETRIYRETTSRQIAALERRLESADGAAKVAEADIGQLRRDVQAERARCASVQAQATQHSDDLDAARKQVAELQNQAEQLQEKLRAEQEKMGELETHAESDRRKHLEILENERQEARRMVGQKIAQAILPDVRHLREVEQEPASADQAKFLRALLGEMLKRLRALDVPIEG